MTVSSHFGDKPYISNDNFPSMQLTMNASNNSSGGKIKNYVEKSVEAAIGRVSMFHDPTSNLFFSLLIVNWS